MFTTTDKSHHQSNITGFNSKPTVFNITLGALYLYDHPIIADTKVNYYSATNRIHMHTMESNRPSIQTDVDVVEQGRITNQGKLHMIRLIRKRLLRWTMPQTATPTYHRTGGPAKIVLRDVHETVIDNKTTTDIRGNHEHEWFLEGKQIRQQQMDQWLKTNGIILREGNLVDQSAFNNNIDYMAFLANPPKSKYFTLDSVIHTTTPNPTPNQDQFYHRYVQPV